MSATEVVERVIQRVRPDSDHAGMAQAQIGTVLGRDPRSPRRVLVFWPYTHTDDFYLDWHHECNLLAIQP